MIPIPIEDFEHHLKNIPLSAWEPLFKIVPKLKKTQCLGKYVYPKHFKDSMFAYKVYKEKPIVEDTIKQILRLNLMPVFDWMSWEEGYAMLKNPDFDYSTLNALTLCKLLTYIFREDRFNFGFLYDCFENRSMVNILDQLTVQIKRNISQDN